MAFESTAINDLVAGLQQKPLGREPSDWLFGESEGGLFEEREDVTQIDPGAPVAPDIDPMRAVALPRPFAQMPMPMAGTAVARQRSSTTHVHHLDWRGIAKKLALPIGVVSIISVALGVYFAKTDEAPRPTQVASAANLTHAQAPAPSVAAPAPPAPSVAAAVEPARVDPVEPAKPEPAPAVEPPAAPQPAPTVEPGSPASRFLAPPPVETTIQTAAKPAPAPTAVPELVASTSPAAEPAAEPVRRAVAKRAGKKPAAKAVARKSARAAKARASRKSVAAASASEARDTRPAGKGVLQITSSPSMQVWVDGRNSKAMTPVRIRLLAGKHRVSLLDNQRGKARSFDVVIKSDETTKISKSY